MGYRRALKRAFPAALAALAETQAPAAVPRQFDDGVQQEAGEYAEYGEYGEFAGNGEYAGTFDDLAPDGRRTLLTMPISDDGDGVLAWDDDPDADQHARHRRP